MGERCGADNLDFYVRTILVNGKSQLPLWLPEQTYFFYVNMFGMIDLDRRDRVFGLKLRTLSRHFPLFIHLYDVLVISASSGHYGRGFLLCFNKIMEHSLSLHQFDV